MCNLVQIRKELGLPKDKNSPIHASLAFSNEHISIIEESVLVDSDIER